MQKIIVNGRILKSPPIEISNRRVRSNIIEHVFLFENDLEFLLTLIVTPKFDMQIHYINDEVFIYEFGRITKIDKNSIEVSFLSIIN